MRFVTEHPDPQDRDTNLSEPQKILLPNEQKNPLKKFAQKLGLNADTWQTSSTGLAVPNNYQELNVVEKTQPNEVLLPTYDEMISYQPKKEEAKPRTQREAYLFVNNLPLLVLEELERLQERPANENEHLVIDLLRLCSSDLYSSAKEAEILKYDSPEGEKQRLEKIILNLPDFTGDSVYLTRVRAEKKRGNQTVVETYPGPVEAVMATILRLTADEGFNKYFSESKRASTTLLLCEKLSQLVRNIDPLLRSEFSKAPPLEKLPEMPTFVEEALRTFPFLNEKKQVQLLTLLESVGIPLSQAEDLLQILPKRNSKLLSHPLVFELTLNIGFTGSNSEWIRSQKEKHDILLELLNGSPQELFDNFSTLLSLSQEIVLNPEISLIEGRRVGLDPEYGLAREIGANYLSEVWNAGKDYGNYEIRRDRHSLAYNDEYRSSLSNLAHFWKDFSTHISSWHMHFDASESSSLPLLGGLCKQNEGYRENGLGTHEIRWIIPPHYERQSQLHTCSVASLIELHLYDSQRKPHFVTEKMHLSSQPESIEQLLWGHFVQYFSQPEERFAALKALNNIYPLLAFNPMALFLSYSQESWETLASALDNVECKTLGNIRYPLDSWVQEKIQKLLSINGDRNLPKNVLRKKAFHCIWNELDYNAFLDQASPFLLEQMIDMEDNEKAKELDRYYDQLEPHLLGEILATFKNIQEFLDLVLYDPHVDTAILATFIELLSKSEYGDYFYRSYSQVLCYAELSKSYADDLQFLSSTYNLMLPLAQSYISSRTEQGSVSLDEFMMKAYSLETNDALRSQMVYELLSAVSSSSFSYKLDMPGEDIVKAVTELALVDVISLVENYNLSYFYTDLDESIGFSEEVRSLLVRLHRAIKEQINDVEHVAVARALQKILRKIELLCVEEFREQYKLDFEKALNSGIYNDLKDCLNFWGRNGDLFKDDVLDAARIIIQRYEENGVEIGAVMYFFSQLMEYIIENGWNTEEFDSFLLTFINDGDALLSLSPSFRTVVLNNAVRLDPERLKHSLSEWIHTSNNRLYFVVVNHYLDSHEDYSREIESFLNDLIHHPQPDKIEYVFSLLHADSQKEGERWQEIYSEKLYEIIVSFSESEYQNQSYAMVLLFLNYLLNKPNVNLHSLEKVLMLMKNNPDGHFFLEDVDQEMKPYASRYYYTASEDDISEMRLLYPTFMKIAGKVPYRLLSGMISRPEVFLTDIINYTSQLTASLQACASEIGNRTREDESIYLDLRYTLRSLDIIFDHTDSLFDNSGHEAEFFMTSLHNIIPSLEEIILHKSELPYHARTFYARTLIDKLWLWLRSQDWDRETENLLLRLELLRE